MANTSTPRGGLVSVEDAIAMVEAGTPLMLAGDERALSRIPKGNWIGGTIPYFMAERGGCFSQDEVYVTHFPESVRRATIKVYDSESLERVYKDAPFNGFSLIIVPALTPIHQRFGQSAVDYEDFAKRPLIGWISGIDLGELGTRTPKVYAGDGAKALEDVAVVMHVSLRPGWIAELDIINIFEPSEGDVITFPEEGFQVKHANINGVRRLFSEYLKEIDCDVRFPLVSDSCGVTVNVSFQSVDHDAQVVNLYAPVFRDVDYHLAKPISDYLRSFMPMIPTDEADIFFACNCILNYLHSELEGKQTGNITGPVTFGEIAYQLLNQTLAYIKCQKASSNTPSL